MKAAYPEVEESMSLICDIVEDEERLFTRTLGKGEALFGKVADEVAASSCSSVLIFLLEIRFIQTFCYSNSGQCCFQALRYVWIPC